VIVKSTIDLAHNLGLGVVAEGVETEQTYAELKRMGCDIAQGYYLSRPVAIKQFNELLEKTNRSNQ
jgi:EAL domain-containing protein (putative c-di-GMP-specific phosphodiesterase class I)